jgi:hypothetical protein
MGLVMHATGMVVSRIVPFNMLVLACWSVKVFFDKVDGSYRTGNVGGSGSKVRCDNGSC